MERLYNFWDGRKRGQSSITVKVLSEEGYLSTGKICPNINIFVCNSMFDYMCSRVVGFSHLQVTSYKIIMNEMEFYFIKINLSGRKWLFRLIKFCERVRMSIQTTRWNVCSRVERSHELACTVYTIEWKYYHSLCLLKSCRRYFKLSLHYIKLN